MKIVIASEEAGESSNVSAQAARAPYLLFFEDNKLVESLKNPFAVGGGGAGFAVAKLLETKGVKLFVAGKAGPNLASALEERGIEFKEAEGSVEAALKETKK